MPAAARRDDRPYPGERIPFEVLGGRVVAEVWGEGPAIYLMHGWGGWRAQLGSFVGPLVESGHQVVAFDALGHGESDPGPLGRRNLLVEFAEVLRTAVGQFGLARAVVAHSAGCPATAVALLDGLLVERLVFIAPMADFQTYTRPFAQAIGISEPTRASMVDRIERLVDRPRADFEVAALARSLDPPPVLVVHDRQDRETAFSAGAAIAEAWPQGRLVATQGLGHRRILGDPAVVAAVAEFAGGTATTPSSGGLQAGAEALTPGGIPR